LDSVFLPFFVITGVKGITTGVDQCYVLSNLVIKAKSALVHNVLRYFRWKYVNISKKNPCCSHWFRAWNPRPRHS